MSMTMDRAAKLALLAAFLARGAGGTRASESVRIDSDGGGHLVVEAGDARSGDEEAMLFVDAGSSGSKAFAFCGTAEPKKASFTTQCLGKPLGGIAALSWNLGVGDHPADCPPWDVHNGSFAFHLNRIEDYSTELLRLLKAQQKQLPQTSCQNKAKNGGAVPMLATAGMRLLSQSQNTVIWSQLCGKTAFGVTIAAAGPKCGTIPGTAEAYYEFLAHAHKTKLDKVPTGTFNIGGASAQITVPLITQDDWVAFGWLIGNVTKDLVCANLKLADGTTVAPVFSSADPSKCAGDYIDRKLWSDVRMPDDLAKSSGFVGSDNKAKVVGVGLISFLGLSGSGTLVAGGVNEIQAWAAKNQDKCTDYAACVRELQDKLANDVLWKHVKDTFKDHPKWGDVTKFSYNTNAAVPYKAFLANEEGAVREGDDEQAWNLETNLTKVCGANFKLKFGFQGSNTCMKAYFTSLFITAFFGKADKGKLAYEPTKDWADGASTVVLQTSETSQRAETVAEILKVPLRTFSANYVEGAMMHFAADDDM